MMVTSNENIVELNDKLFEKLNINVEREMRSISYVRMTLRDMLLPGEWKARSQSLVDANGNSG